MIFIYIPKELLNKILEYDGRIKYKNGKYINIIHKNDMRYNIILSVINKKIEIMKKIEIRENKRFYFEIIFDGIFGIGLCYDYNFSWKNIFEICYYDFRKDMIQIRTCL